MYLLADLCCALRRPAENALGERNSYLIQNGEAWSQTISFKGSKAGKEVSMR